MSVFLSLYQAYVQQLETSRIKLAQLEQDLQRLRSQVRELNMYKILYSLKKKKITVPKITIFEVIDNLIC